MKAENNYIDFAYHITWKPYQKLIESMKISDGIGGMEPCPSRPVLKFSLKYIYRERAQKLGLIHIEGLIPYSCFVLFFP
jgi:hypothetical protein